MKRSVRSPVGFYTIGMAALFMTGFFLLVVFGAEIYGSIVSGQNGNNEERSVLAYIAAEVKSGDQTGGIEVFHGEGSDVLIIRDDPENSEYAVRVYLRNGRLMEDYGRVSGELNPGSALALGKTQTFQVEAVDGNTLSISTDEGRVLVSLKSEGGIVG